MAPRRYVVTAERVGRRWALRCPDHPDADMQVAMLEKTDQVRQAIAAAAGTNADDIAVDLHVELPGDALAQVEEARTARERAREADAAAAVASRQAVHALHAAGLSIRDIGTLMGISGARAHQLFHSPGPAGQVVAQEAGHAAPPASGRLRPCHRLHRPRD